MKKLNGEELHSVLLEIAKAFHDICERNKIPYFMLGGTMLGAVRHKGIIPWDDDMDFGVPREYFEKLKKTLREELPSNMEAMSVETSESIILDIIKIQDKRTLVRELFRENLEESFGVNVDVFPLDRTLYGNNTFRAKMAEVLKNIQQYRFLSLKSRPIHKKIAALIIKTLLFCIDRETIINIIRNNFADKQGGYIANYYGAWGRKEIIPHEIMEPAILYKFEDTNFYGVRNYDSYLTSLYGDYMMLPPEEKRHFHLTDVYWKD